MAMSHAKLNMIERIKQQIKETASVTGIDALPPHIEQAFYAVPREHFFPPQTHPDIIYANQPSNIGYGQTISQPYIVALMTALLNPQPGEVILEVGTGSGYQAAILAEIGVELDSIEIIPELFTKAQQRLNIYPNINCLLGDAQTAELRPHYDGIVVTAAPSSVPKSLQDRLASPGRMVIPVGTHNINQQLLIIGKDQQGEITTTYHLPVRFVPLLSNKN